MKLKLMLITFLILPSISFAGILKELLFFEGVVTEYNDCYVYMQDRVGDAFLPIPKPFFEKRSFIDIDSGRVLSFYISIKELKELNEQIVKDGCKSELVFR